MNKPRMSDNQKKEVIKSILGANHSAAGKNFPIFSEMMDGVGHVNNTIAFAELLPVLSSWLSGATMSAAVSAASFAGVLLFPLQQMINVVNANETGLRSYSYRSISYTITAWAFDKPVPMSSPMILSNLKKGPYTAIKSFDDYHKVWRETSVSVLRQIDKICLQNKINKKHLKSVFKALGTGKLDVLSVLILKGFEQEFSSVSKQIWASNYSVYYPR